MKKLSCAVVDDQLIMLSEVGSICERSSYIEKVYLYSSPSKFLKDLPTLDVDGCLLDISMPEMDGMEVAKRMKAVKNIPVIFMTLYEDKLKEALDSGAIDVLPKPFNRERLDMAFKKTMLLIEDEKAKREYGLFNVAKNGNGKVKLKLTDILYVKTDKENHRNKNIITKNRDKYLLMNLSNAELLNIAPTLLQANKSELVSIEVVEKFEHDNITTRDMEGYGIPKQITLNRAYRVDFKKRFYLF